MKQLISILIIATLLTGCAPAAAPVKPDQPTATNPTGFALGNTLPPMAVDTIDGQTLDLNDLLKDKKLVVLNFWFADCVWCVREFPAMELAYQRYQDSIEILGLNPTDNKTTIAAFRQEHSLSFPVASCSRDTALAFGVSGYPTSVFIDREGKICLIHSGAITDPSVFYQLFDHFTAEDYQSRSYESISQLIK